MFWFRRDLRLSDHPALSVLEQEKNSVFPVFLFSTQPDSPLCEGGAATWWQKRTLLHLSRRLPTDLICLNVDQFSKDGSLGVNGSNDTNSDSQKGPISPSKRKPSGGSFSWQSLQISLALASICKACSSTTVAVAETAFSSFQTKRSPFSEGAQWISSRVCLDMEIGELLKVNGIDLVVFPDSDLADLGLIRKDDEKSYQVFTPFYKRFLSMHQSEVIEADFRAPKVRWLPFSNDHKQRLDFLGARVERAKECRWLDSSPYWSEKFVPVWNAGAGQGREVLEQFGESRVERYQSDRDFPSIDGTSRLSPYLAFGEISSRQIWGTIAGGEPVGTVSVDRLPFLRQLVWRLFSKETLRSFPTMVWKNFQSKYDAFPWNDAEEPFEKWKRGKTGVPIVDAAMRQLWETGWMHNRLRMVVGSFLVKNLQIHWSKGEEWFWDTLVDADIPNNIFGWQWVAGTGLDAAPFFRIFNPLTQSQKFDSEGLFLKRYLPVLNELDSKQVHDPFGLLDSKKKTKKLSGLFDNPFDYPAPMVDLKASREDTLSKFQKLKNHS